ncbi:MAG: hypothetical protein OER96_12405, partial [Gammaproteobacteria bacterium]|nr:hypothetical protein [Gammaproteobacteria bacterium]
MANILICTVGVYSHINTLSGVAKRLVAAGHKVRLLLQRIQHVNALGRQGYKIYCTTPSTDVNIPDEQLEVECSIEADKCLERIKPDLVLADAEWHEVIVRSLKLNLNIVGLDFHCSPDRWS